MLSCNSDRWDAIWHAEMGSSGAVMNAGYNIASLLHRCAFTSLLHAWVCIGTLATSSIFKFA